MGQPQCLAGKTSGPALELGHLFFVNRSVVPIVSDSTCGITYHLCGSRIFFVNSPRTSLLLNDRLKSVSGRPCVDPLTWQKCCSLQCAVVPFKFLFIIFGNATPFFSTGIEKKNLTLSQKCLQLNTIPEVNSSRLSH